MKNPENLCMGCMRDLLEDGSCSACDFDASTNNSAPALPLRTILSNKYIIGRVIENNGEGITYLAYDLEGDHPVRIREYFPVGLCERKASGNVKIINGCEYSFNEGIIMFLELCKKLYRLRDLPVLMPISNIIEENGTAYSIADHIVCITLREMLVRNGGTMTWEQARHIFIPVISALSTINANQIIHRGISPDTIVIGRDKKPRITGFCIQPARTAKSFMSSQLFPGFAAIEQYGVLGIDGEWTDVYGLAATLYRTLIGTPPPEAVERMNNDSMSVPQKLAQSIPEELLESLANALQILPEDRVQSLKDFRCMLEGITVTPASKKPHKSDDGSKNKKKKQGNKKYVLIASIFTALGLVAIGLVIYYGIFAGAGGSGQSSEDLFSSIITSGASSGQVVSDEPQSASHLYSVPEFKNMTYSKITQNTDYSTLYKFEVGGKKYSDIGAGKVCEQSPAAGTPVEKGAKIVLTISLGPANAAVPSIMDLSKEEALLALLEAGFTRANIDIIDKYDDTKSPNKVIEVAPNVGSKISVDSGIVIYINSYKELTSSNTSSRNQ